VDVMPSRSVGARWITYTVLLLAAAVIIALLLPTRYSLGLLDTLGYLLNFIIALVQAIFYALLALILNLLSRLFPDLSQPPTPPTEDFGRACCQHTTPTSADFIQSLILGRLHRRRLCGDSVSAAAPSLLDDFDTAARTASGIFWHMVRAWSGGLNQRFENLLEAR
jgi:hypothetical protein